MATVKFYRTKYSTIVVKFSVDRNNRFELATGEGNVPAAQWDLNKQRAKSKFPDHLGLNQSLDRISNELIQLYRDNKTASIEQLKAMAKPLIKFGTTEERSQKKNIYPILAQFIKVTKSEKDIKTAKKFEALYMVRTVDGEIIKTGHLWEFDKDLEIDQLDNNFLDAWKGHLYGKGLKDSTVFKYIKALSQFITWAALRGHEVHGKEKSTHKTWEIIERRNEPITLTREEFSKIESIQITQELIDLHLPAKKHGRREYTVEALKHAQVYAIMEYRTGQRISDIKSIKANDFDGMIWNNRVTKGQRLLGKVIRIPFDNAFMRPAYDILVRYNFNMPVVSEQKLNKNMKSLCRIAGITQPLTVTRWSQNNRIDETKEKCDWVSTHTMRKSFITNALQFLKPKLVKDVAGISWNTLKYYEGQSEVDVVNEGFNSIPVMKAS